MSARSEQRDSDSDAADQIAALSYRVDTLSRDLEALQKQLAELLELWRGARSMLGLIRWLGGIATAIAAIVLLIREWHR